MVPVPICYRTESMTITVCMPGGFAANWLRRGSRNSGGNSSQASSSPAVSNTPSGPMMSARTRALVEARAEEEAARSRAVQPEVEAQSADVPPVAEPQTSDSQRGHQKLPQSECPIFARCLLPFHGNHLRQMVLAPHRPGLVYLRRPVSSCSTRFL